MTGAGGLVRQAGRWRRTRLGRGPMRTVGTGREARPTGRLFQGAGQNPRGSRVIQI